MALRIREAEPRTRRTAYERVQARYPGIYVKLSPLAMKLGPRSRLKQRLNRREMRSGWDAVSRGDWELVNIRYAPDLVYEFSPELVTLGLPARVEGREEWVEALQEFLATWEEWRFRPRYLLDLDGRVLNLGHARYRGQASGVEVEIEYAQLVDNPRGVADYERDFSYWTDALRAAGLPEDLPARLNELPPGGRLKI